MGDEKITALNDSGHFLNYPDIRECDSFKW